MENRRIEPEDFRSSVRFEWPIIIFVNFSQPRLLWLRCLVHLFLCIAREICSWHSLAVWCIHVLTLLKFVLCKQTLQHFLWEQKAVCKPHEVHAVNMQWYAYKYTTANYSWMRMPEKGSSRDGVLMKRWELDNFWGDLAALLWAAWQHSDTVS